VAEVRTVLVAGLTLTVITGGVTVVELVELAAAEAAPPQEVIKLVKATAESRTSTIPNVRTFIPRPQQSRDEEAAALVGRFIKKIGRHRNFCNARERSVPLKGGQKYNTS
jgi:hypothetical protein